ncbi:hypothetical protein E4U42_007334 [Claviceps africana]|uniref:DNA repair protein REV1 n=1 Tax=Claviceps africana TaxID=83212 RepID=A0A8K0J406_9HYPO|nr:hypothetical protein E4U42_007334 [Claviceps africana]
MGSVLDKNSSQVRKRIENHKFDDEDGDEYEGSAFGGFGDYFRRKKIKLQNLDADLRAASDKPHIFKGIVAHITGYTQPPLHVLRREIVQHGGGYLQYLDSKTMATHIIASTLPPKKSVDFNRYRIVKPAWIVDSVAAGRLLPWGDYRVLDEGPRQKVLKLGGESGLSQATPEPKRGYKEQTDNSFYTSQFRARAGNSLPSQQWSQLAEEARTPTSPPSLRGTSTSQQRTQSVVAASSVSESKEALRSPSVTGFAGRENAAQQMPPPPESPPVLEENARPVTEPPKNVTPEEHNAWLLSDPRLRKSSTANPEFLKQFYSESRLHHLSTWKANLKSSMQRMAAEKGLSQNKLKGKRGARRYIMHVDFDSFFCAVSLKQSPQYADKPAVVAHSAGPGSEIASCNYPAREFGVKNGMWMKRALELCPDLKVLPYDFPAYEEASRMFYESILSVGGVVQSVSIDEALIDATSIILSASGSQGVGVDEGSIWREQQKADEIASGLRNVIKEKTGCDVSVGIGGNVLQAKVALRKAKPAGQFQLKPEDVLAVVGELTVEQLPGVAYSIGGKLEELGIRFVKDIRGVSREQLAHTLGPKTGEKLADYARGIDRVEVGEQPPRRSVSAEVNWGIRFISQPEAEEFVLNLCKELERRLVSEQVRGKHLTMKIMRRSLDAPLDPAKHLGHGKCDVFNKSAAFGVATYSGEVIGKEAISMLRSFKFSPGDLRGLGVQMTKLEPIKATTGPGQPEGSQRTLSFGPFAGPASARRSVGGGRVVEAIDEIESPEKPKKTAGRGLDEDDPIAEDPLTPRRPKTHPAMALSRANQDDAQARTPLNVSGTQFIMPSNPDLAVMAELPHDIRRKLMSQQRRGGGGGGSGPIGSPSPAASGLLSRPESPERSAGIPSQIDPEVFNALPKDVQAEVLATYGRRPPPPQTPKRDRRPQAVAIQQRKQTTPTKRGGLRGMFGKAQRQYDAQTGVVQTRFRRSDESPAAIEDIEELDPDFLAQLPDDVRNEIVADHRRRRMALRSGLNAPNRKHHVSDLDGRTAATATTALAGNGQHKIRFPGPPKKVPFSSSGVTSTPEIKDMIDAWHSETRDEGPHEGDVAVLEKYLVRVVKEERDLEKVVVLVRWLDVLVERDGQSGEGGGSWREAVRRVKAVVQRAVGERGIGPLDM